MAGPGGYAWGAWGPSLTGCQPQWVHRVPIPGAVQLAQQTKKYTVDPHNHAEFQVVVDAVPELRELDMSKAQDFPHVPMALRSVGPAPAPRLHTLTLHLGAGVELISQMLRANEPTLRELSLVDGLTTLLLPNDADILMEELHLLTRLTKLHLRADVRALNQPFIFQNRGRLREVDIILIDYTKDTIQSIISCNRGTLLAQNCFLAFIDGDSTTYAQSPGPGRHFHMETLSWMKLDCTGPLAIAPLADFFE